MEPTHFLGIAALAVVVFVGLDLRSPAFRASLSSDRCRRWRNVGYALGNLVSIGGLMLINGRLDALVPRLLSWQGIPLIVEVAACVVVAELINWLSHWIKHVRPWLWTFHVQHHVGRHYDTTLTLHTHAVDVVVSGAAMSAVLMLLGFGRFSVDVFVLAYFVTNLYKHGHTMLTLGPVLDRIIVSPAYHRVHHTPDARGNYGSVLTLFDVVFGTAVWPSADIATRPVGVDGVEERGFIDEMLLPIRPGPAA
jgi:sterol desaturase/sphingolipid hydroxylase (fatty acid hydroxylase superfamily)